MSTTSTERFHARRRARSPRRDRLGHLRRAAPLLGALLLASLARAQVSNDGSLGVNGPGLVGHAPNPGGGLDYFLTESDGALVGGTNLFHSLDRMDLGAADALVYQGSPTIENLITRITGGGSTIDGTIRSEIAGADLFLINADGLFFGENAQLDVSGAVVVSTADEVRLGAAGRFDARPGTGDVLTVDAPSSVGFLAPPAPIVVAGSRLEGADGESLALIGGDLTLSGARADGQPGLLSVRGGRIDLASLASSGSVRIQTDPSPDLVVEGADLRGDVSIRDDFVVSTSGIARDPLDIVTFPIPGSGPVLVRARDLLVEDSEIRVLTLTDQPADRISIELTGDLTVRGLPDQQRAAISSGSGLTLPVPPDQTFGARGGADRFTDIGLARDYFVCEGGAVCGITYLTRGASGDIEISARDVVLEGGGQIVSRAEFQADAGRISLDLSGDLSIRGVAADGNRSGVLSNAVGSGNQGAVVVRLPEGVLRMDDFGVIVIENGEQSLATGTPGSIAIEARALQMSGNARIDSSTRGAGSGGAITIDVREEAELRGTPDVDEFTGISTLSQPGSTGPAGTITLSAGSLVLRDGARIAAQPVGADAFGDAGSLDLRIVDDLVMRRGILSTESAFAAGGNIGVAAGGLIDLVDSSITTSVTRGASSGGNIRIEPPSQALVLERSQIVARADEGAGGNIRIVTNALLIDDASVISASSNTGIDGTEVIRSLQGEVNVTLPELPVEPIDAGSLLREPCAARDPGEASTFLIEADAGPRPALPDLLPAYLTPATDEPPDPAREGSPGSTCPR